MSFNPDWGGGIKMARGMESVAGRKWWECIEMTLWKGLAVKGRLKIVT